MGDFLASVASGRCVSPALLFQLHLLASRLVHSLLDDESQVIAASVLLCSQPGSAAPWNLSQSSFAPASESLSMCSGCNLSARVGNGLTSLLRELHQVLFLFLFFFI